MSVFNEHEIQDYRGSISVMPAKLDGGKPL
jgi:hypothetical protein